jgi:hypothetical protein
LVLNHYFLSWRSARFTITNTKVPEKFFRSAKIEVVQLSKVGDSIEEKVFTVPLDFQIKPALEYLNGLGETL